MASDSEHSDSDNEGKGETKNVQIQEIVESGNKQEQIEEIGDNKSNLIYKCYSWFGFTIYFHLLLAN
jgi:hypothetical protein